MAPRTAKTKKAAAVEEKLVSDVEAPKKGRGKAKAAPVDLIEDLPVAVLDGKAATESKSKRGKKVPETNGQSETNGSNEELPPPIKKGRKKNAPIVSEDGDATSETGDSQAPKEVANGHEPAAIGISEDASTKGRKKATKKDAAEKTTEAKSGRGKKKTKEDSPETEESVEKVEVAEEKPKSAGKGKGRKAQSKESEQKTENGDEEEKIEPAPTKGKKKAKAKVQQKADKSDDSDEPTEKVKPQKKEVKPRKNQGKKALPEADSADEDKEDKEDKMKEETEVDVPAPPKKATKKGKGDSKEDVIEIVEPKLAKVKRGQKKVDELVVDMEAESQAAGEANSKRKRRAQEDDAPVENAKKKAPLKNKAATDYEAIDFSNSSRNEQDKDWNLKIASWNVDGIRAWMGKGGLDYIKYEKPDILCLQEVKCSVEAMPEELANIPGYHAYWLCSDQDGYAGVGVYTTKLAMNVQYGLQSEELDSEGRIITAEYEQFYLICTYVPNASRKLVNLPKRLQWNEEFRRHVKKLDEKKPVIICGDMNVAHTEIDLSNPKTNRRNAGFTDEERAGMADLLGDGFVDVYRRRNPDKTGAYTFWTYMMNCRAKNVGWRLDYFLVSERLMPSVCDSVIRDQVYGSDHCPISLFLHLTTADKPKE